MTARQIKEMASTTIVVLVALTMLALYLIDRAEANSNNAKPYIGDLPASAADPIRMGPHDADMVISTFMDFTCPICRDLVGIFDSLLVEFPDDIAVEFHHFPLKGPELSWPIAVAAECAHAQGRFTEIYHLLYAKGGLKEGSPKSPVAPEAL